MRGRAPPPRRITWPHDQPTGYGAAEVADRLAIQDLIARYAVVIDNRDFDALDPLFTADARIDFTTFNGPVGDLAEIKAFLAASLPFFAHSQHMMGLPYIELARRHRHRAHLLQQPDDLDQARTARPRSG